MTPELEAKLQSLEEQLAADPESEELRQEILFECLSVEGGEPRRIHHAVEYVRRFPRTLVARAPFVHVDQATFPDAFARIEAEWLRLRAEHPRDPELAQGHAALVAPCDRERAVSILDGALQQTPEAPGLWLELGRICPEPTRSLGALQRARALGAVQPNLLTWLARAAVKAGDEVAADQVGHELLAQVSEARAIYVATARTLVSARRGCRAQWRRGPGDPALARVCSCPQRFSTLVVRSIISAGT